METLLRALLLATAAEDLASVGLVVTRQVGGRVTVCGISRAEVAGVDELDELVGKLVRKARLGLARLHLTIESADEDAIREALALWLRMGD